MKKIFLVGLITLSFVSCKKSTPFKSTSFCGAPDDVNQFKSQSIASEELIKDTLENLRLTELSESFKGEKGISAGLPKVISKRVVSPQNDDASLVSDQWQEDWIVQRDGYRVTYHITFMPSSKGGTDIVIKYPPNYRND